MEKIIEEEKEKFISDLKALIPKEVFESVDSKSRELIFDECFKARKQTNSVIGS